MIKNIFLTAYRNCWKQKTLTTIQVAGLSIGLLCSVLIFLFVYQHYSTDTFYSNADRIYRVVLDIHIQDGSIEYEPGTSLPLHQALQEEYAAVEQSGFCMQFFRDPQLAISAKSGELNRFIETEGVAYVNAPFLSMFSYRFIEGNPGTALNQPNQVIITQQQAQKYFPGENALGKTIRINDRTDLVVTGVVENRPVNTDIDFNVLISLSTLKVMNPNYQTENFTWIGGKKWNFVKLSDPGKAQLINEDLPNFVDKYLGDRFAHWHFRLQPLSDMHFDTRYGGTIRKPLLHLLSAVALIIVLTACINFVNLSTALAISRSKEIGARKALGSSRWQIFWQFITETSLIVGSALILVTLGLLVGLSHLNSWIQSQLDLQLLGSPSVIIGLLLFVLLIVFSAGSYPALVMSGFHPIRALNNQISTKEVGGYRLRQLLSFLQFTIAQAFIIGAVVVLYQLNYFQKQDLGFRQKAVITTKVPRSDYSRLSSFRNQLKQHTDIRNVSFHQSPPITSTNEGGYVRFDHRDGFEPFLVRDRWADEEYLETYDLQLLAGRNIVLHDSATEFLVNEKFVAALGISSDEVLGKHLYTDNASTEGTIVGVVKNFHHQSLQNPIEPLVIYPYPRIFTQAGIQIQSENISLTLQQIQTTWEVTFPDQVFTYQFLEDSIQQLYEKEQRIAKLIRLFTIVSILICSLGMIGLAMYTAQQRTKEIGIRKTLGASTGSILLLLSKSFTQLLLFSFVIAVAIANYVLQDWLADFAYRVNLEWWMFAASGLLMFFVVILSIGSQTLKAAQQNPVDSLRDE